MGATSYKTPSKFDPHRSPVLESSSKDWLDSWMIEYVTCRWALGWLTTSREHICHLSGPQQGSLAKTLGLSNFWDIGYSHNQVTDLSCTRFPSGGQKSFTSPRIGRARERECRRRDKNRRFVAKASRSMCQGRSRDGWISTQSPTGWQKGYGTECSQMCSQVTMGSWSFPGCQGRQLSRTVRQSQLHRQVAQ